MGSDAIGWAPQVVTEMVDCVVRSASVAAGPDREAAIRKGLFSIRASDPSLPVNDDLVTHLAQLADGPVGDRAAMVAELDVWLRDVWVAPTSTVDLSGPAVADSQTRIDEPDETGTHQDVGPLARLRQRLGGKRPSATPSVASMGVKVGHGRSLRSTVSTVLLATALLFSAVRPMTADVTPMMTEMVNQPVAAEVMTTGPPAQMTADWMSQVGRGNAYLETAPAASSEAVVVAPAYRSASALYVDPSVGTQSLSAVRQTVREAAEAFSTPDFVYSMPSYLQDQLLAAASAEGDRVVSDFNQIYAEEMERSGGVMLHHLPPAETEMIRQEARIRSVERLNLGHSGGVGQVDLQYTNEVQLFEYLRAEIEARGNTFRTEDMAMNIIGVRGLDHGVTGENAPNVYNDTLFVLRYEEGQPRVYLFVASTDYGDAEKLGVEGWGRTVQTEEGEQWGPLLMVPGGYTMRVGTHARGTKFAHEALRDQDVVAVPDLNQNSWVDPSELFYTFTDQGMNVHRGGPPDKPVSTYSAGCQIIPVGPAGDDSGRLYWNDFHQMITEDPAYGTASPLIPYTLAAVTTLPSTR